MSTSPNLGARVVEFLQDEQGADARKGAALLEDLRSFIKRFCFLPDEFCYDAVALWISHSYIVEALYTTPRLAALSPEYECGKTRLLDILSMLCFDPMT